MEKSKDKRLEEKEKIDAEIERSLSVAKMKQAHAQIEEIEKSRKRSVIASIVNRLETAIMLYKGMIEELQKLETDFSQKLPANFQTMRLGEDVSLDFANVANFYESLRFDLKQNINVKDEDYDKLFPKLTVKFDTYKNLMTSLMYMSMQMIDMMNYCIRLL
jgi:hypothetical protein